MEIHYETLLKCILCSGDAIDDFDRRLNLARCRSCGLIFDNPRPSQECISRYYSEHGKYDAWLDRKDRLALQWRQALARIQRFKASGDLLDVGAGIGHFISFARSHFNCTGTEISSEGVRLAREMFGVDLLPGSLESIDMRGRIFDLIVMFHVLEHLPSPGETIRFCRSLLKPGGILYLALPNEGRFSLRLLLPAVMGKLGLKKYRPFRYGGFRKISMDMEEIHLSHFSEPGLRNYMRSAGFDIAGSGIDFIDPFMFRKGPVQVLRYLLYAKAVVIRAISGINIYSCFWIAARKACL
jgi:SAM-dependent methyltransferase